MWINNCPSYSLATTLRAFSALCFPRVQMLLLSLACCRPTHWCCCPAAPVYTQSFWPIRVQHHSVCMKLTSILVNIVLTVQTSISSSSPSHMVRPTRRYMFRVWRSKIKSVSNFSSLSNSSFILLALSSVSFLLCCLSSFKISRRKSINVSVVVDILIQTGSRATRSGF